jgi:protein-disulfide isomerase
MAEAVALQGRFWPMHETLFHHQKALEAADRLATPRSWGSTSSAWPPTWTARPCGCGKTPAALACGARGTPTLFVDGRLHAAGYDEPTLAAALERAMEKR